jgi:hypothetical protein
MTKIKVFFVDGSTYEYAVKDVITAKKYAHSITNKGFRIKKEGKFIYLPVAKIDHVEVLGDDGEISVREVLNESKGPEGS